VDGDLPLYLVYVTPKFRLRKQDGKRCPRRQDAFQGRNVSKVACKTTSANANLSSIRDVDLSQVYSESVAAKIIQVAQRGLKRQAPLRSYPHTVPQVGPDAGRYEEREADFWTCGFFPGCIYALLERSIRYPQAIDVPEHVRPQIQDQLLKLGRHYGVAINQMSGRRDTHDMGFIVQPALQKDWELTGNKESLQSVVNAAYALASRYDDRVKAIRSWDVAINDRYSITDMSTNFLVIIDSMCSKPPTPSPHPSLLTQTS
jgi:hypothetical protein